MDTGNQGRRELLEFGPFQLHPDNRLFRNGTPVSLAPKEAAVLRTLAEAEGRIVPKDELIRRVWLGTAISDTSLTTCIYLLRKHLADSRGSREVVESVYGRGYRLSVPVRRLAADRTLLVMPAFAGRSNPVAESLAALITADLVAAFGRSGAHGVSVIGAPSAERLEQTTTAWQQAARDRGAQFVLLSTLGYRSAQELSLEVELRRADDRAVLLARRFECHPQSPAAMAEAVVKATAQHLPLRDIPPVHGRLRRAAQTEPKVYEAYLEARHCLRQRTPDGIRKAIGFFTTAVQWDAAYAPAYVGLADSWSAMRAVGAADTATALAKVRENLAKAEALDPAVPGAGILRAATASLHDWDFEAADALFRIELDRDPTDVITLNYYIRHLIASGRVQAAAAVAENLVELDPLSAAAHGLAAFAFHFNREPERAQAAARHASGLDPRNCLCAMYLALTSSMLGDHEAAMEAGRRSYELSGELGSMALTYALACARAGRADEARSLISGALAGRPRALPSVFALAYAALDDEIELRHWLNVAVQERCLWLPSLRSDPWLDGYRSRPWARRLFEHVAPPGRARQSHLGGAGAASGALLQA